MATAYKPPAVFGMLVVCYGDPLGYGLKPSFCRTLTRLACHCPLRLTQWSVPRSGEIATAQRAATIFLGIYQERRHET